MNLNNNLLRDIFAYGFEKPSTIQKKTIVPIIKGGDIIGQAQSGTGKTAAFCIGSLQVIDTSINNTQNIILAPTRELANQIFQVYKSLGQRSNVNSYLLVGGNSIYNDINNLNNNIHSIIGTPGRIYDMIKRKCLNVSHLKILCIDEADEMLSRGFQQQIYNIFQEIPDNIQVLLFSATMPKDILDLTDKFMRNPTKILVKNEMLTLDGIKQFKIIVEKEEWKISTLLDLYESLNIGQCIIYCNRRNTASLLANELTKNDFEVGLIHGSMSQDDRNNIMKNFRSGSLRVLISTDLLARGIDIQGVSLVVNYDIPYNKENYIHRIGRSGRYGRKGIAINFATFKDQEMITKLEQFYNTEIEDLPIDFANFIN